MVKLVVIWLLAIITQLPQEPVLNRYRITGFAQGTTYTISYYATGNKVTQNHIDLILNRIDSSLSIYKTYSQISRFNAASSELVVDSFFQTVVNKSIEVFHATDGAFDITVLPLLQTWGLGTKKIHTIPDTATINALLPCVGSGKIRLKENMLYKARPCIQIDVNGIAQGYSVDVLAELLELHGIDNYLVELGGEIRVKGRKQPSGEVMTIGIEAPSMSEFDNNPFKKTIKLPQGAITTSGNYRKFYDNGSKRITHLINPATGFPIDNELISVTVFAKDAITADGFDNAFMVMGLQKSLTFLKNQNEMEAYFIYHKGNGSIADTATQGFYKMIVTN